MASRTYTLGPSRLWRQEMRLRTTATVLWGGERKEKGGGRGAKQVASRDHLRPPGTRPLPSVTLRRPSRYRAWALGDMLTRPGRAMRLASLDAGRAPTVDWICWGGCLGWERNNRAVGRVPPEFVPFTITRDPHSGCIAFHHHACPRCRSNDSKSSWWRWLFPHGHVERGDLYD